MALWLCLTLGLPAAAWAQTQSSDQRSCIDARNKAGAKVARTRGKQIVRCLRDAARGRLGGTVEACLESDPRDRLARAQGKALEREARKCEQTPDFGSTSATALNSLMTDAPLALVRGIFGAELLESVMATVEGDRPLSKCQQDVLKQTQRCLDTKLKVFNRCKRKGLKGKLAPPGASLPFDDVADLALCLDHDPAGKLARVCGSKLLSRIQARCGEALGASAFPGCETSDPELLRSCLERDVECEACLALRAGDALGEAVSCDLVDDGEANGSCGAPDDSVCGDGTVDPGEDCDPPGTTVGCAAEQTCGFDCACVATNGGFTGARSFKSGPIQITADGRWVWVVNPDHHSVSRIDTADHSVVEYPLPAASGPHAPRGLSVAEDGSTVWVACHDSDRVFVLEGATGAVLAEIELPWGSGPAMVALSRDQSRALVSLHRAAGLAVLDIASRTLSHLLAPVFAAPLGIVWTDDGSTAWVTHPFADDEHPFVTRVDFASVLPRVKSRLRAFAADPRSSSALAPPFDIAEGGYLTFRGHVAQIPAQSGLNEIWLPTQYNNITEDGYSPDSTVQATLRRLRLATRTFPNTNADKVILSAVHVHDPAVGGNPYVGPGWDAGVGGPIDIGFSQAGDQAVVVFELSNDVIVLPTNLPAVKPAAAPPLNEIPVGDRPMGLAISPTEARVYVTNRFSRDVSVIDLATQLEILRVAVTPTTGEPFPPSRLVGARLFHSSDDSRISANSKVSCASCHPNAEHDGRSWALQNLPGLHGPRPTLSLLGVAETFGPPDPLTGFGQLHISGDRDEVQDFEHTFRGVQMGGTGFLGLGAQLELGPPNAGLDADLDAIADYVLSLPPVPRSPHRAADGSLSEAAVRGATFFMGSDSASLPADASCAGCHVPETGFVDFAFHDVGQRRSSAENELNQSSRSPYQWHVNTPSLRGLWVTPPYRGVSGFTSEIADLIADLATRTSHGTPSGLTGRQRADLGEFLLSIDGNMTAAEVRGAADTTPPRVVRVEPASLTTVDVWFDETVNETSAENLANWSILRGGTIPETVSAATWDAQNGDRVRLTTSLQADGASPVSYFVVPGPILDAAATASGGVANALDTGDATNTKTFLLGSTLTLTLGASGYENLTVPVHDAGMIGPGLSTWGHDAPWLFPVSGGRQNKGFVRFEWQSEFTAITGLTASADIVSAELTLEPIWGEAQTVEIRRCLQPWSDPSSGGDWNSNPLGGPTWRDHAHPSASWNQAGAEASTAGIDGTSVAHYGGSNDLADTVDAAVAMQAINEPVTFSGVAVRDAFRFWLDSPAVDYGYAFQLGSAGLVIHETKFRGQDRQLRRHGPVLTLTYTLPTGP